MEQPPSASLPRSYRINQEGSEARPEVLPGVRFHNTDYVKELRRSFEPPASPGPVGASAGKEFRSRAIPGPGPSQNSALCGSPPTKCTPVSREKGKSTVIPRRTVFFLPPRAAQLRVGPVPKVVCRSPPATPPSSPFLQGKPSAWINLAAIPPHLRRGKPRRKCSGRPGHGRPGRWRRGCRPAPAQCGSQDCQPCLHASHAARHPLRRPALRIGLGASYPDSSHSACSRAPSSPASTSSRAHSFGPFRPRRRRESAHPRRRSLSGSGSLRSPSPCTAKARRIPTLPDTLRRHAPLASLVPRPWSLGDSKPGLRPSRIK